MQIHKININGFFSNTYAITADGKTAVVIDPSSKKIESKLIALGLEVKYVLLTHSHFDHVGGVGVLQQSGAKVFCLDKEKPLIGSGDDLFEEFGVPRVYYNVDQTLIDGQEIELCGLKIKVISTGGHTVGSASYIFEDDEGRYLFTGDTLFKNTVGRTDLPTSSFDELRASLKKLSALDDMPVYAGHGWETTLQEERENNPFLRDL
ncbi:MAG: MBL fold metallo-hydrolase [Clostridia bacterium]|nr:MBL fold metallo-hydrolase [Clostridia bacterium]